MRLLEASALAFIVSIASASSTKRLAYDVKWATQQVANFEPRPLLTVNGTWPPPPLFLNSGDTAVVTVTNHIPNETTSIHHHGLWFRENNANDGVAGISQCGIPPGESFTYTVHTMPQTGTYWYHSHVRGQLVDGMKGPLIIKDAEPYPKIDIDDEYTLVISDWYEGTYSTLHTLAHNASTNMWGGKEPVPNGAVIYALDSKGNRLPGYNENVTLPFVPGKNYRMRLLHTGTFPDFFIWVDHHVMDIIELDGVLHEPAKVDRVSLSTGQRTSIVVQAKETNSTNYKMHININPIVLSKFPHAPMGLNHTVNIGYNDKTNEFAPVTHLSEYKYLEEDVLLGMEPLKGKGVIGNDQNVTLVNTLDTDFNNASYKAPVMPTLIATHAAGTIDAHNTGNDSSPNYILDYDKGTHIRIFNAHNEPHSYHLHGQAFQYLGTTRGANYSDPSVSWRQVPVKTSYRGGEPAIRDTIVVPDGAYADIAFVSDNVGAWFLHCHMSWHLSDGLAAVLVVGPEEIRERVSLPAETYQQCRALGFNSLLRRSILL